MMCHGGESPEDNIPTIQSPSRRIQAQPPRLTKIILFLRCSRDLSKIKIQIPRDKIARASTANLPLWDWVEVGEEEELGKPGTAHSLYKVY
ncbi:hypothetical protein Bca4012_065453 [Brassica carinata]|uniref:Uncharacterized protein n=1 Tax=Brassica carinata TaxID=52824 RepID=A0A8X7VNJ8_BRACI|nr:hypothetical protein Bca52824_017793 [Brassica carinata]